MGGFANIIRLKLSLLAAQASAMAERGLSYSIPGRVFSFVRLTEGEINKETRLLPEEEGRRGGEKIAQSVCHVCWIWLMPFRQVVLAEYPEGSRINTADCSGSGGAGAACVLD